MSQKFIRMNSKNKGEGVKEHNTVSSSIIVLLGAIIIFLIIGQFFLPITTIEYDGKKKNITLLDFALSGEIDVKEFTSNDMFFLTEEITMKEFLNKSNISIDKFFNDNGISSDVLLSNVKKYKSAKQHTLLVESYQDILDDTKKSDKTSIYNTDVPMSEFILANKLTNDVKIKAGSKTVLTASLTSEQFNIIANNYFESSFISKDGIISFIIIISMILCIFSLLLMFSAYIRNKNYSPFTNRFIILSFGSISFAKILAFLADIIIKGEFSGDQGKYTNWTRFITELSPKDEVHISNVPIHIAPVLVISIIISLVITIIFISKNKKQEK